MGVVEYLIKGKDGLVHAVHIRMGNYKTTRPIVKLHPLEISCEDTPNGSDSDQQSGPDFPVDKTTNDEAVSNNTRTRRGAATRALKKMAEWTNQLRAPPEDVENY